MFDTAIGGDQICSATQAAELPQNARQDQPGWVAPTAGSVARWAWRHQGAGPV
jgi:hypothetical protein